MILNYSAVIHTHWHERRKLKNLNAYYRLVCLRETRKNKKIGINSLVRDFFFTTGRFKLMFADDRYIKSL